jgi:ABC-2 type transport system permease protein
VFFYLGLILFSAVIGIVVCALAFRFGGRAHVGATSIVSVLILLSGIYYPIDVLPEPLKLISYGIPITYFLEYFRAMYGFEASGGHLLTKGFLLVLVYLVLAITALRRVVSS